MTRQPQLRTSPAHPLEHPRIFLMQLLRSIVGFIREQYNDTAA
jgi:hypothetical protein